MKKRANYELTGDRRAVPYYYPSDDCWGEGIDWCYISVALP